MGRADERRARQSGARRGRAAGKEKGGIRRFFTWKKMLGTFFGICLLGMGAFLALYMSIDVPATGNAAAMRQSNVYKYSDGTVLGRTGSGEGPSRENVDLDKIPKDVQWTFVAAENMSFFEDEGIDFKGTARGLLNTVTGKGKQGGSTITQQYVKNYYLTPDQTISRKLKELVISLKVDDQKSKQEILLGYINTSYYGRGAAGIQAAAQAYYGKPVEKLSVEEGAYLAALLQAPSSYDVLNATPRSKALVIERWNYVLDNMVKMGKLKQADRAGMKFPKVQKQQPPAGMKGQVGYLVEAAKQQLKVREDVTEEQLAAGGWTITLNIDKKRQKDLEKAVDKRLESKLDRNGNKVDATVQAGATSVDPKTGAVVALYGGAEFINHQISNATRTDYQPASTFKPFIFASALENGSETQDGEPITANTIYDGTSRRPVVGSDTPFSPQNEDDEDLGDVTVQKAMAKSVNSVFAQMIVDVGPGHVRDTAMRAGMQNRGDFGTSPAMSLGTMSANTMDMAGAYASLAAHGKRMTPSIVKQASHKDRPDIKPVGISDSGGIDRQAADTTTSVLQNVMKEGSGKRADSDEYEAAGKTGTSEENKSAWFAGYTPRLATAVALFGQDPKSGKQVSLTGTANAGRANGGGFPAEIWREYTLGALSAKEKAAEFDLEVKEGAQYETPAPPPETTPPPVETTPPPEPEITPTPEDTPTQQSPTPTETPGDDAGTDQGQDQGQDQGGENQGGENQGQSNGGWDPDPDPGTDPGGANGGAAEGNENGGQNGGGDQGGNANGGQ
ncbi:transglycosylase domain-containing protein [Streptomyces sp. NPDC091272]|uniref:transglycosylase domain-containing protein n=1 Tax=Streptomyces sp. NPDC091272 TaxID=3365981 RepID=UPI003806FD73